MANFTGTAGNDLLTGTSGNDVLNGLGGIDTMVGGHGNDVYHVDTLADRIIELAGGGTDTIISLVNINGLADNVENGILASNGTNNTSIFGNALNNRLSGNALNNQLGGGDGSDTMNGGAGDDGYEVNSVGDLVIEDARQGTDSVASSISYTLGSNVENLVLLGTARMGTGNELNNLIYASEDATGGQGSRLRGLAGNDTLIGGASIDTMEGGIGNDVYEVRQSGDLILENSNAGTDGVTSYANYTLSANVEDLSLYDAARIGVGNSQNNILYGSFHASSSDGNLLYGMAGNDVLVDRYGSGAPESDSIDTLVGGAGNDVYIVHRAEDVVVELAGEGIDEVWSYSDFTLSSNVEDLYLMNIAGQANPVNGTGNALDNILSGNDSANLLSSGSGNDTLSGHGGDDTLDGGLGADAMEGGAGNDTYWVDDRRDRVTETLASGGDDLVMTTVSYTLGANVERLTLLDSDNVVYPFWSVAGNALDNVLIGNSGRNTLNGLQGNDTMRGGSGDDLYFVGSAGDVVIELADGGIDTVNSTVSWTLGANIEGATLAGYQVSGLRLIGNELSNSLAGNESANMLLGQAGDDRLLGMSGADSLYGGDGADSLDGGSGVDTMSGGNGNDTYIVDNTGDSVSEGGGDGIDSVISGVTYALGEGVEHLQLSGSSRISGHGNSLDNRLTGNSGNNLLNGGAGMDTLEGGRGVDTLTGGAGADVFHFGSPASGNDTITDFVRGTDKVQVSSTNFTGLPTGALASSRFVSGTNPTAATAASSDAVFLYNTQTGQLSFDSNGRAAGGVTAVAVFTGRPALSASDIQTVSAMT